MMAAATLLKLRSRFERLVWREFGRYLQPRELYPRALRPALARAVRRDVLR